MTPRRLALCVLVFVFGCGSSKQREALDQIGTICRGLTGQTIVQAEQALSSFQYESSFRCPTGQTLLAPFSNTCPPQSTSDPECAFFWEWQATDPGLCNVTAGGCCFICEARVMEGSITQTDAGASTPICASRWITSQPCQLL